MENGKCEAQMSGEEEKSGAELEEFQALRSETEILEASIIMMKSPALNYLSEPRWGRRRARRRGGGARSARGPVVREVVEGVLPGRLTREAGGGGGGR